MPPKRPPSDMPIVVIKRWRAAVFWYGTIDGKLVGPKLTKDDIDKLLHELQWREIKRQLAARNFK